VKDHDTEGWGLEFSLKEIASTTRNRVWLKSLIAEPLCQPGKRGSRTGDGGLSFESRFAFRRCGNARTAGQSPLVRSVHFMKTALK